MIASALKSYKVHYTFHEGDRVTAGGEFNLQAATLQLAEAGAHEALDQRFPLIPGSKREVSVRRAFADIEESWMRRNMNRMTPQDILDLITLLQRPKLTCANCGAQGYDFSTGPSGQVICCPHCIFSPEGCRCRYGDYGVPEPYGFV